MHIVPQLLKASKKHTNRIQAEFLFKVVKTKKIILASNLWAPDVPRDARNWRSNGGAALASWKSAVALKASSWTSCGLSCPQAHFSTRLSPSLEVSLASFNFGCGGSAASLWLIPPLLRFLQCGSSSEAMVAGQARVSESECDLSCKNAI